jgi:hypothetical protein
LGAADMQTDREAALHLNGFETQPKPIGNATQPAPAQLLKKL